MAGEINQDLIKRVLPHRYPFLFVDKVLELVPPADKSKSMVGAKAVTQKNVTHNEPYFNGHFPNFPILPGVILVEAMAQTGGLACFQEDTEPSEIMIAGIKDAKFRKPVVPGDIVIMEAEIIKDKGAMKAIYCDSKVDGTVVAESRVMAYIRKGRTY